MFFSETIIKIEKNSRGTKNGVKLTKPCMDVKLEISMKTSFFTSSLHSDTSITATATTSATTSASRPASFFRFETIKICQTIP